MPGSLFLIHWVESEAQEIADRLFELGWQVEVESKDEARAGKRIKDAPPDLVVISLAHLPSHGRETADYLQSLKATRSIPLVFVDGAGEALEKNRNQVPHAVYTSSEALPLVLNNHNGYAPVQGGELYFETTGSGPALLLIHAGIADYSMWDDQYYEFARHYRVVRFDARGYGRSRTESVTFSNRQDILELLDHLGIGKTIVIGVSRGGQMAVDFTLEHPERVSALIPVAAGLSGYQHTPDGSLKSQQELEIFTRLEQAEDAGDIERLNELEVELWADGPGQPAGRATAYVRERVRRMNLATFNRQDGQATAVGLEPPAIGRLNEIHQPTLVIVGSLDTTAVLSNADLLEEGIAGAHKVIFSAAAHMLNMEFPEYFNQTVLQFLSQV